MQFRAAQVVQVSGMWTPTDVARFLGIPVATLYQWRRRGVGPPARRVGRHLRYDPDAVQAWFNAQ
jgi:DNA-binding transcriptional MerR regulator